MNPGAGCGARAGSERGRNADTRDAQGRGEAEENSREERYAESEQQNVKIGPGFQGRVFRSVGEEGN